MERESEASLTPTHIWCLSSVGKVAIRIHSLGYSSYRLRWEHDTQEDTLIFYAMTGVEVPDVAMLNTLPPISGQAALTHSVGIEFERDAEVREMK